MLGHRFNSEVMLLAVDMPDFLDAPMMEPSGRAVWYSFGTLMAEAVAMYLQVSPEEVQVGVRPTRDLFGRVQGEVFIYDNVPGGAAYVKGGAILGHRGCCCSAIPSSLIVNLNVPMMETLRLTQKEQARLQVLNSLVART